MNFSWRAVPLFSQRTLFIVAWYAIKTNVIFWLSYNDNDTRATPNYGMPQHPNWDFSHVFSWLGFIASKESLTAPAQWLKFNLSNHISDLKSVWKWSITSEQTLHQRNVQKFVYLPHCATATALPNLVMMMPRHFIFRSALTPPSVRSLRSALRRGIALPDF